jgi:hypothetical protein
LGKAQTIIDLSTEKTFEVFGNLKGQGLLTFGVFGNPKGQPHRSPKYLALN